MTPSDFSTVSNTEPNWVGYAVWWQIYPLGFVGAPQLNDGNTGRDSTPESHHLTRIIAWLDYAVELGASGIALGPIFQSETHGYDTTDYLAIDSRLGDDADFARLIAEAHARGLRVMLDGVFNHVGRRFAPFQRVLSAADSETASEGAGSEAAGEGDVAAESNWFIRSDAAADVYNGGYRSFEGHAALVELNKNEPAVADFVVGVMNHWLGLGADGWRLDAAYSAPPEFWASVLPRVRDAHPDAYIVGEVLHGDYAEFVTASGVDSVTQYELWKALWSAVNDANFFELAWAMDRHNGYLETFVPLTFVGNHDVTRLASAITDSRHLAHALVVLFTVGGTPTVYYGDEQAFRGIKEQRAGGDDAVRPEFPKAGPDALSPLGWPTYHLHQELIGLRRRHPWLHRAQPHTLQLSNGNYVYALAEHETPSERGSTAAKSERLVVSLNLDDSASTAELPAGGTVIAGQGSMLQHPGGATLSTPAHGWAVVKLHTD